MRRSRTRSASAVYTADGILGLMKITSFILPLYIPFRVYARKRCYMRYRFFFRATHEKGRFLPQLSMELLLNPRYRLWRFCLTAKVRLRGYTAPLSMTISGNRCILNRTTPADCHPRGSAPHDRRRSMSEMKVAVLCVA